MARDAAERLSVVQEQRLVAIVRGQDSDQLAAACAVLHDAGINIIEITMTVPRALEILAAVKKKLGPKALVGAGTILDPETARAAMLAGAEFLISPNTNFEVVKMCRRYGVLSIPGAFSPTEIVAAWEAGADLVKVFPADVVGPAFFKAVKAPLPQIRLLPSGGVDEKSAPEFLRAGASCVSIGGCLLDNALAAAQDWPELRRRATAFLAAVASVPKP
jgi:2-dehydro-3-deoxyphosphogluconate aldolase / (4S)-4-hydroxy-2-oxoglutarate aldolase